MRTAGLLVALLLAACTSAPPVPAWQASAHGALQAAVAATLNGDGRVADAEMARARREIGRTGQPALLARAELVLCAARVSSLDVAGCPAYEALAIDAEPAEQAYAAFLYGQPTAAQQALLPAQHRSVAAGAGIAAGQDALAQLIATAVLVRQGRAAAPDLAAAVDTASAQGWRRAVLAWLGLQLRAAQAAGDDAEVQRIRRRLAVSG